MTIALNSYGNIATGLGSEGRWLWRMLPFHAWIQGMHPKLMWGTPIVEDGRPVMQGAEPFLLEPGDTMVCIERPISPDRKRGDWGDEWARLLTDRGVNLVVLANPEWTSKQSAWLPLAHNVIARTASAQTHLATLGITAPRCQVPVNVEEFDFRIRSKVARVVFSNGWGGIHQRKGSPEVIKMLGIAPGAVSVYSQREIPEIPHLGPVEEPRRLYAEADLVIVPSRFEGVGLSILEAMASGCLVAATDAEPMSEFIRSAYGDDRFLFPVERTSKVLVAGQKWTAHHVDPKGSLEVIARIKAMSSSEIEDFSAMGREYIESHHGKSAAVQLWEEIVR